jgi:hypothetical protein
MISYCFFVGVRLKLEENVKNIGIGSDDYEYTTDYGFDHSWFLRLFILCLCVYEANREDSFHPSYRCGIKKMQKAKRICRVCESSAFDIYHSHVS